MKMSKKSKLLALTLGATMLVSAFSFSVSAETPTIGLGEITITNNEDGTINVSVPYTLSTVDEQATILATVDVAEGVGDIDYDEVDVNQPVNIVYIDQEKDDGLFEFVFDPSTLDESYEFLFIKVGGSGVDTPDMSAGIIFVEGTPYVYGDVNGDGNINASDASLILQYFAKTLSAFPAGPADVGDVNADGNVNASDASLVLQYFAKTLADFPANNK